MFPQVFKRFVEVGRVALVADGPDKGKLCVIVDVINQRSVSFFTTISVICVYSGH